MGRRRSTYVVVLAALGAALVLGLAERGSADTVGPVCAGKPICVTVTDQDQASRSPGGSDHYLSDVVTVSNAGSTSKLVNVTVTITWADDGDVDSTTSDYRPAFSDPRCTVTAPLTISCSTPKSLDPGDVLTFDPLVFRTATDDAATGTSLTVTAAAKEQSKPNKGGAPPNDAVASVSNPTTYEGSPDQDISIGGGGIVATLATAQSGAQFTRLPIPAGAPRGLFEVLEADYGGSLTCPAGLTCFGQHVTTIATGVSPVNVQITFIGSVPSGTTVNNLVVFHTRDDDTTVHITSPCSSALFSGQPPLTEMPCRRVAFTRLPGGNTKVEVDAWDLRNGSWGVG